MNKLLVLLIVSIVGLGSFSGLLLYQHNVVESENTELRDELASVKSQLEEQQNISLQLESQVVDLQNQKVEFQNQIIANQNVTAELEEQILELKEEIDKKDDLLSKASQGQVVITNFTISGFEPYVGLTIHSNAQVRIHNFGKSDLSGLNLSITNNENVELLSQPFQIQTIHAGEELVINKVISWGLGISHGYIARLMHNNTILDEYILS